MEKQIMYKDLSTALKLAVISAWIFGVSFVIGFAIGFWSAI